MHIEDVYKKYSAKIDRLDLELLIAAVIGKPREFVLTHPEYRMNSLKIENLKLKISRRRRGEPLAYILEQKEFYGLNFKVNESTLVPRPETELLVEEVIKKVQSSKLKVKRSIIIDVGTGSGNIVIALSKILKNVKRFIAVDISDKALRVAKRNAKRHRVGNRIEFLKGNLLEPILKNSKFVIHDSSAIVIANLPYLSRKIYASVGPDIKKYEPRGALVSDKGGLAHYEKLLKQIRILKQRNSLLPVSCFLEISPEQKRTLQKLIFRFFPEAKATFHKDLSGRWRVCRIDLQ